MRVLVRPRARGTSARPALRLTLVLACLSSVACDSHWTETVHGSGVAAARSETVSPFERLWIAGSLEAEVEVGSGPTLQVRGDSNLLEFVEFEQRGDLVVLRVREGFRLEPPPRVQLLAPALRELKCDGEAGLRATGLRGEALDVVLTGSGVIWLAGKTPSLRAQLTGSGELRLDQLVATEGSLELVGSGLAEVDVREVLDVEVIGSGRVRHRGCEELNTSITGGGRVEAFGR